MNIAETKLQVRKWKRIANDNKSYRDIVYQKVEIHQEALDKLIKFEKENCYGETK